MKVKFIIVASILSIQLCGCSKVQDNNSNSNVAKQSVNHSDSFSQLETTSDSEINTGDNIDMYDVEDKSYNEMLYENSEYKTEEKSETEETDVSTESTLDEFEYDLSNIEYNCVKELIIELYNDNNYSSYELYEHSLNYDYMNQPDGTESFVVLFNDSDYWLITYDSGKAFALKDEYDVYGHEEDSDNEE